MCKYRLYHSFNLSDQCYFWQLLLLYVLRYHRVSFTCQIIDVIQMAKYCALKYVQLIDNNPISFFWLIHVSSDNWKLFYMLFFFFFTFLRHNRVSFTYQVKALIQMTKKTSPLSMTKKIKVFLKIIIKLSLPDLR